MARWHCNQCRREFDAPASTTVHFHKCSRELMPGSVPKLTLPADQEGRSELWHGLLSLVAAVHPTVDHD